MRASDVSMRCTRDSLLISSEKSATGTLFSMAAYCATFSVNAVFPIDGLAATMMRSDGWKPDVSSSRSPKPLATPVMVVPPAWSFSIRSIVGQSSSLRRVNPSRVCSWLTWKIFDSASSSSSRAVTWPSNASVTIDVDTSISRRRIDFSRTICAWYSMFAAVGTASTRKPM